MIKVLTIPGINNEKITAVNFEFCCDLAPRDVHGMFVINVRTKEFVYCNTCRPYDYVRQLSSVRHGPQSYKVLDFIRAASSINEIYVIFPTTQFLKVKDFPISGYEEFARVKKIDRKKKTRPEDQTIYKITDTFSKFTCFSVDRILKPRVTVVHRLQKIAAADSSDPHYHLKVKARPRVQSALDNIARLAERRINPVAMIATKEKVEGRSAYGHVNRMNQQALIDWLKAQ